jgi:hypothetical protein
LKEQIQTSDIIGLYLGGQTPQEIAVKMGITRQAVEYHLNSQKSELNFKMLELTENLALVSLARLEYIVKMIWPAVSQADLRAVKTLIDVTKLEIEWRDRLTVKKDDPDTITIELEKIEQTITGSSPLYSQALTSLQEDWMAGDQITLESLYEKEPPRMPDDKGLMQRINNVEDAINKVVGIDDETS